MSRRCAPAPAACNIGLASGRLLVVDVRPKGVGITVEDKPEVRKAGGVYYTPTYIVNYIVELVRNSRTASSLSLGASPRAGVMLLRAAKTMALVRGKSYVTPDEVRDVLLPVLRHRVRLTPEAEIEGLTADACIESLTKRVPVPR